MRETPRSLRDLGEKLLRELKEFFATYQRLEGKEFKVLGVLGPKEAEKLVKSAERK
jgi:inorganic pyrophosphatase